MVPSATTVADVAPADLVVHVVGASSSDVLEFLRSQGVAVREVDRFDPRSPHCNKISAALSLAEEQVQGLAVLCDTDIVVLDDPRRIEVPHDAVAGKVVDAPVPPLEVALRIFEAAGIDSPGTVPLPWGHDERTVAGNTNGGLYLVPGTLLGQVATAWAHWARWLLDRSELLEQWTVYVDQVSMALGLADVGVTPMPLEVRWNTPVHDPTRIPPDPPVPSIVHYHQEVDRQGLVRTTGRTSIDDRVDAANEAIRVVWARASPSDTYRQWLAGSEQDEQVRTVLATLLDAVQPATVLDAGADSGVGSQTRPGQLTSIEWWKDLRGSLTAHDRREDLVVCLETMRQPLSAPERTDLVRALWGSTDRALVLGSPGSRPSTRTGDPSPGHDLTAALREVASNAEIYPIPMAGSSGALVVALAPPVDAHPLDFGTATLSAVVDRHPDPLLLLALRLHARQTTGFFPDHPARLWEYPAVARLVSESLVAGSRLVDVGAGATPLPPFLSGRGYVVDTVDPSPRHCHWPPAADCDEPCFVDYAAAGFAHRSWNCSLGSVPHELLFDGAYAVNVIEQVPAASRRDLLADIASHTRPDALVVLTTRLVAGRHDLWNRQPTGEVEHPDRHGHIGTVIDECAAVGLELTQQEVVRDWGDPSEDIGLLALRRTGAPATPGRRAGWRRLRPLRGSRA